uniref:TCF/LEF n=2 Tax=Platynereis dumerilii TaxID=6359 RepID=A0A1B1M0Q0_PLADU|nr:TCF/LEF [Platynereis dumerilii]
MPHVNSSGGDDLASTDEVKVYKDEGEEEKRSSENLSEDKLGLVTETEEDKNSDLSNNYPGGDKSSGAGQDGKNDQGLSDRLGLPGGYLFAPYHYANGASLGGKMPLQPPHPGALSPLMMYNSEHLTQPPPAHMGIPPVHIDPKTGLPRHPMYAIPPPPGQFHHPLYSPEFSQMQWSSPPGYPITTSGLRSPYPSSLSSLSRFSPPGMLPHPGMHPGLNHPAIITPGPKQEINSENHRPPYHHHHDHTPNDSDSSHPDVAPKRPHVKKPLNAFMLFMKEMRAQVAAECTLKESAAINQILGRRWHALDRSEQAKYYEMARKEKELHMQLYPGWSARDNYAANSKKKKRKRETSVSNPSNQE